jgi:hypothetical protein
MAMDKEMFFIYNTLIRRQFNPTLKLFFGEQRAPWRIYAKAIGNIVMPLPTDAALPFQAEH